MSELLTDEQVQGYADLAPFLITARLATEVRALRAARAALEEATKRPHPS